MSGPYYGYMQPFRILPEPPSIFKTLDFSKPFLYSNLPSSSVATPNIPATPANFLTVTPPTLSSTNWNFIDFPGTFIENLNVDGLLPQPFDEDPPALTFAGAPGEFTVPPPDAPGVDITYTYPTLNTSLPAPPNLLSLNIAPFAGTNLPTFSATEPTLTAYEPTLYTYTPGSMYSSALLSSMASTLQARIQNGGTGLPPAIEQAIWDRAREREYKQMASALADLDRMEILGYAFPPGIYADARIKIQTEANYNIANQSREVMIKQAELELTNILKALDTATQLEAKLIDYNNQIEQRSFEAVKYMTQAGIELYNAKVRAYSQFVDAYKAKIAVYEAQVRAETTKVEIYKAQVAAEEAKAQINTALVNQYKVSADIALSAIEIYKAQIAGIQAKAEIEKTKVMIFGEEIKAYASRISAYTAQTEAYKAGVQAEATKQEAFKAKVQAYSAQVDASGKIIQAKIEEYKGKIQAKTNEYEGYKAYVSGEGERVRALASNNQSIATLYQGQVSSRASVNDSIAKTWSAAVDAAVRNIGNAVEQSKGYGQIYSSYNSAISEYVKGRMSAMAQIKSAELNQYNLSTSMSNQTSVSNSYSNSYSESLSA